MYILEKFKCHEKIDEEKLSSIVMIILKFKNREMNFKKLACDQFLTEKKPKMKFFDFGAFQKIMKMLSREKIIFACFLGHLMVPPYMIHVIFTS